MTKPRKVFGRRRFYIDGKLYKFELRSDGLYVREYHKRREFSIPFGHLLRLSQLQPTLFTSHEMEGKPETHAKLETSNEKGTVCSVQSH